MRAAACLSVLSISFAAGACNSLEVASPVRPSGPPIAASAPADPAPPADTRRYPSNGPDLVSYIMERHPDRLVAGVSHHDRVVNMEFLRDEMIRAGVCGGMDLARNLKRGVGPHSIDAITWRHPGGQLDVVDIAAAYDDTGQPLRLHWLIVEGPAGYDPLPPPSCR